MIYVLLTSQSLLPTEAVEAQKPLKAWLQLQKQNLSTWDHRGTGCRLLIATQNQRTRIAGKNGSVRELHLAFWSAPPLNYSEKAPQHLWRQVILHGLVSCCGRIVSSFTLSLFPCRNWHCFIVLLGWTVVMWQVRDGTSRWSLVGAGGQ